MRPSVQEAARGRDVPTLHLRMVVANAVASLGEISTICAEELSEAR